jgi:hypothetical protein
LYDKTVDHILTEHPEMRFDLPSLLAAVGRTVWSPTHVEASYRNSCVFMDSRTTNRSGDPLRVQVKRPGNGAGRVKTYLLRVN